MSLGSTSVAWSFSIAKSKKRVIVYSLCHFAALIFALWLLFDQVILKQQLGALTFTDLLTSSSLLLFIGGFYPCMYVYTVYHLLDIQRSENNAKTS